MKRLPPPARTAVLGLAILAGHAVLLHVLDGDDVVHRWLAGGHDARPGDLVLIAAFAAVRMVAVVALPGLIGMRLAMLAADAAFRRHDRRRHAVPPA